LQDELVVETEFTFRCSTQVGSHHDLTIDIRT